MTRRRITISALLFAAALPACSSATPPRTTPATAAARPPASRPTARHTPIARSRPAPAPKATPGAETGTLAGLTAAHNEVRASVRVAPLVWSDKLGAHAQAWADHLASRGCDLAHRPPGSDPYGENLFWSAGTTGSTVREVVGSWAAEKTGYNHAKNSCSGVCGHYTQIVWRATTAVGCGMASCGTTQVWVCNYDPPGNMMGRSPY